MKISANDGVIGEFKCGGNELYEWVIEWMMVKCSGGVKKEYNMKGKKDMWCRKKGEEK